MMKREVFRIAELITSFYSQAEFDQHKINAWHEVLKSHEYEVVKERLLDYVKHHNHPPTIKQLIQDDKTDSAVVPDYEETKAMLQLKRGAGLSATAKEELAKIRALLGIEGERL
nr:replicative helicase loader/inhibitor [Peribacillus faecalis]